MKKLGYPSLDNIYYAGSGNPIYSVDKIIYDKYSDILILPWNIKTEIIKQFNEYEIGTKKFITTIPELSVI